jgi:hypothetical protein
MLVSFIGQHFGSVNPEAVSDSPPSPDFGCGTLARLSRKYAPLKPGQRLGTGRRGGCRLLGW